MHVPDISTLSATGHANIGDKAVNGIPGVDSASKMAEDYMKENCSCIDQANSLILWQNTKAGTSTSGFLSCVGGLITMPVSPTDIYPSCFTQQINAHMLALQSN